MMGKGGQGARGGQGDRSGGFLKSTRSVPLLSVPFDRMFGIVWEGGRPFILVGGLGF